MLQKKFAKTFSILKRDTTATGVITSICSAPSGKQRYNYSAGLSMDDLYFVIVLDRHTEFGTICISPSFSMVV